MWNVMHFRERLFPSGLDLPKLPQGESVIFNVTHFPWDRRQDEGRVVLTNRRLLILRPVGSQLAIDGALVTEIPLAQISSFRPVPAAEGRRLFLGDSSPTLEVALRSGGAVYLNIGDPKSWDLDVAANLTAASQNMATPAPLLPTDRLRRWLFTSTQVLHFAAFVGTLVGTAAVTSGSWTFRFGLGGAVATLVILPFPFLSVALWRVWGWSATRRQPKAGARVFW